MEDTSNQAQKPFFLPKSFKHIITEEAQEGIAQIGTIEASHRLPSILIFDPKAATAAIDYEN